MLLISCACQTTSKDSKNSQAEQSIDKTRDGSVRDNALYLLADLLGDEKNVSKVLIIKHASPEIKELIKRISRAASTGMKSLKPYLADGKAPKKESLGLPQGELAAREAISKTKEHALLHSSGNEFEFQLLLTQSEALNYGAHLARVVAENDTDSTCSAVLNGISSQLEELRDEVFTHLRKGF